MENDERRLENTIETQKHNQKHKLNNKNLKNLDKNEKTHFDEKSSNFFEFLQMFIELCTNLSAKALIPIDNARICTSNNDLIQELLHSYEIHTNPLSLSSFSL